MVYKNLTSKGKGSEVSMGQGYYFIQERGEGPYHKIMALGRAWNILDMEAAALSHGFEPDLYFVEAVTQLTYRLAQAGKDFKEILA
jgi:hypothetical protein